MELSLLCYPSILDLTMFDLSLDQNPAWRWALDRFLGPVKQVVFVCSQPDKSLLVNFCFERPLCRQTTGSSIPITSGCIMSCIMLANNSCSESDFCLMTSKRPLSRSSALCLLVNGASPSICRVLQNTSISWELIAFCSTMI